MRRARRSRCGLVLRRRRCSWGVYSSIRRSIRGPLQKPRRRDPPGLDAETLWDVVLFAGRKSALGAEHDGEDAVVLGEVGSGRTCALRLGEGDSLSVKRGLDPRPLHVDCESETSDRVPVLDHPRDPEVEAWVASGTEADDNALRNSAGAVTEHSAVDDRVAKPDLSVGPVHRGRQ